MPRFSRPSQGLVLGFLCLIIGTGAALAQSRDQIAPTLSQARHSFTIFAPRGHRNSATAKTASARNDAASFD